MNNSAKYLIGTIILLVGVVGISFYSCEKEEITPNETTIQPIQEADADSQVRDAGTNEINYEVIHIREPFLDESYELVESNEMCGKAIRKHIEVEKIGQVGRVNLFNSNNFLNVLFVSQEAYTIESVKLMVRPLSQGAPDNANPERFKVVTPEGREASRFAGFKIPVGDLANTSIIAGMVKLTDKDGKNYLGWIEGEVFGETVYGKQFTFTLQECTVPTQGDTPAPATDGSEILDR
ncbi:MAG: hypothetical protein ACO2Z9_02770 [Crocinitomicaceae bacterium]